MYGPFFLMFYFLVAIIVIVTSKSRLNNIGSEKNQSLPKIPSTPDPYEMAYLRGSENEVLRLAIFSLVQKEFLKILEKSIVYQTRENANTNELNSIEIIVYNHFKTARKISDTFTQEIKDAIKKQCVEFEDFLDKNNLIYNNEQKIQYTKVFFLGLSIILGLSIYKLISAFYHGKHNVVFLVIETLIASITYISILKRGKLNKRGKEYFEKIKLIFNRLKTSKNTNSSKEDLLVLSSIFGFSVLAGTPYAEHNSIFSRSSNGDYSGGGCGSSSCSSSDGGGGSCGGGGCGGCGGGGD